MTVSNVINGAGRASAATVAQVKAAIADLGYVPNLSARRLANARATTLGLVYSNRRTPFLDAVLVGMLRATSAHGLQLVLREVEDVGQPAAEKVAEELVRASVDALLLIPPFAELLSGSTTLAGLGVPLAAIATGTALPDVTTVRIDNRAAMRAMTRMVVAHGHRQIAYVAGPDNYSVTDARLAGYLDALIEEGLLPDPDLIVRNSDYDHASGMVAARRLLGLADRPTAILCSSDDLASGIIAQAIAMGLRLPSDLSVTGFDDTLLASRITPSLTGVRQPVEDMAFRATQCLIAALGHSAGRDPVRDELVDHLIIERQSLTARMTGPGAAATATNRAPGTPAPPPTQETSS